MKKRLLFVLLLVFLFSCTRQNNQIFQEMRHLEYLRDANPDKFVLWLNHTDEQVRARAVATLGRIQDSTTIAWVANALNDPSPVVRHEAAFAIGQFFNTAAEQPVLDALDLEKNQIIIARLVEAIGKVGTEKSFNRMLDFIESLNPEYEKAVMITSGLLAYRHHSPLRNAPYIGIVLNRTENPDVRWRAAYALYRIASPQTTKDLVKALQADDPLTRVFALKGLRMILSIMLSREKAGKPKNAIIEQARQILWSDSCFNRIKALVQDSTWYVRMEVQHYLNTISSLSLWPVIARGIGDNHPYVREAALEAASNFKSQQSRLVLLGNASQGKNWQQRGKALVALTRNYPSEALTFIRSNIHRYRFPENYFFIKALGTLPGEDATEMLMSLADSDIPAQVTAAIEVLTQRDGVPLNFYLKHLQKGDRALTTLIANYLGALKEVQAVPHLIAAYRKFRAPQDVEPMEAIIAALGYIGDNQAVPLLEQELNNPFPSIRKKAHKALKMITGRDYPLKPVPPTLLTRIDFPPVPGDERPRVRFHTTKGDFVIELRPDKAPVTVANFVHLVKQGFYNGIYFHRVVPGFVVQAGDPRGDGWGGPGYSIPCEYNDLFFYRGVVGMATAGKDTGGSQFFITQLPQPHLNGRYTAFGKVVSGMNVVDILEPYDKILKAEIVSNS